MVAVYCMLYIAIICTGGRKPPLHIY